MSMGSHLAELRRRLTVAFVAIIVSVVAAFLLTDPIIAALAEPIRMVAAERGDHLAALNFDSVTSAFDLRMRIALAVGIVIATPVWMSQIWLFLVPALTRREILSTVAFVATAGPLFFCGCVVGWLIAPHAIALMAGFAPEGSALFFQQSLYYDFILKLVIVVGVAFVLPVLLVLCNVVGLLPAKAILKGWRVAIVVAATFAALATPAADVVSMLLLAGILIVLYLAAAGVAAVVDTRRARIAARRLNDTGITGSGA